MIQRLLLLLFISNVIVNSMLIYRSKQNRPKLVCYAVPPDSNKPRSDKMTDSYSTTTIMTDPEQQIHMRNAGPSTSNDLQSHPLMPVARTKRTADNFDDLNFANLVSTERSEPLNSHKNERTRKTDNGFDIDIVGASLSDENRDKIRKRLIRTCEALKSHPL